MYFWPILIQIEVSYEKRVYMNQGLASSYLLNFNLFQHYSHKKYKGLSSKTQFLLHLRSVIIWALNMLKFFDF